MARAACKSVVPKPSVKRSKTGARTARASPCLPCVTRKRAMALRHYKRRAKATFCCISLSGCLQQQLTFDAVEFG